MKYLLGIAFVMHSAMCTNTDIPCDPKYANVNWTAGYCNNTVGLLIDLDCN